MTKLRPDSPTHTRFRFKLPSGSIPGNEQLQSINAIEGVIKTDVKKHRLIVHYDLLKTDLNVILETINKHIQLVMGPLHKWRFRIKSFTDQNMRDHSNHQPQCCGKPPKGR